MPIATLGQVNLSALQVPQALVQIVPPQFLFNGVATNVVGLVGTASWGPVNLANNFGNYAQFSSIYGPTINRYYDMGSYVLLGSAQGAGYFSGVRVTDGSDVAATCTIPGVGALQATGNIVFASNPAANSTITLNGTVWTFVTAITGTLQLLIGSTTLATLIQAIPVLNASIDTNTSKMTYTTTGSQINVTAVVVGTAGNAYTLVASTVPASNGTVSGATLSGGAAGTTGVTLTGKYTGSLLNVGTAPNTGAKVSITKGTQGNSYKVVISCPGLVTEQYDNLATNLTGLPVWTAITAAINSGTSGTRPPSNIVVATVGTATTAPIVNSTWTFSGGTDGIANLAAAGVQATGTITWSGAAPVNNSSITLGGTVITFVTSGATGLQVNIGTVAATLTALQALLVSPTGQADSNLSKITTAVSSTVLTITYNSAVYAGNSFTIAASGAPASNGTVSAATLSGGISSYSTAMIGVDVPPRSGMYALRNAGVAQFGLCDLSDLSTLSTQIAFGISIGAYAVMASPLSDTTLNAQNELPLYGVDSFVAKLVFGDWVVWLDSVNGIPQRVTSPAAVTLGLLGNLSPNQNTLNKPIYGIVGTQSTILGKTYSYSDFQTLAQSRMDLICVDTTLSNNFVHRLGINTSSNPITFGDEYTRTIFFLAKSIQIIAAQYIGQNMTSTEMTQAKVALQNFLALAQTNGIIYQFNGAQAWQVTLDTTNNTQMTAALGYQYAYVKAVIGPIVRYFIINLEGGSSVVISSTPPSNQATY